MARTPAPWGMPRPASSRGTRCPSCRRSRGDVEGLADETASTPRALFPRAPEPAAGVVGHSVPSHDDPRRLDDPDETMPPEQPYPDDVRAGASIPPRARPHLPMARGLRGIEGLAVRFLEGPGSIVPVPLDCR